MSRPAIDVHKVAADRGGKFLSAEYVSSKTKSLWQCGEGHQWMASPNAIQRGYWCAQCAGVAKKSMDDMCALAATKGGKFLSPEYKGMNNKHTWSCASGHEWVSVPSAIRKGSWCPHCDKRGSSMVGASKTDRAWWLV